jgi:hypothetical protein
MAAEGAPRTWTLKLDHGDVIVEQAAAAQEYRDGERIDVIEKEPVLDLLELSHAAVKMYVAGIENDRHEPGTGPLANYHASSSAGGHVALERLEALLRAHGRLKGAGDE